MEITIPQSKIVKTIAILMMLCLHLFNRPYESLFQPLFFMGKQPVSYYISLFSDACVPIFLFISGYGLYFKYKKNNNTFAKENLTRIGILYINYWIVVVLFAVLLGLMLDKEGYPGSMSKFLVNFFALDNSYNGAWWFLFTYILLTFTSPILFKLMHACNSWLFIASVLGFYFFSFYFRFYNNALFTNPYLGWLFKQVYLYGISLFPFIAGAMVLQKKGHSQFSERFNKLRFKSLLAILGIFVLVAIHGVIPNLVIAPFLAIPFIFLWNQIVLSKWLERFLLWLSPHTTNLWLIHMFFYLTYFSEIIYAPKNPILIFSWLLLWSVLASFLVNFIYKPIVKKNILI